MRRGMSKISADKEETRMTLRFNFTIHTVVGSLSGEEDANDEKQLRE